ncbi:MAG: DUF2190 family protein [Pseudomonadota bacterium]|nr:DUF2190 family protein [Pseudomonadota bacterium]
MRNFIQPGDTLTLIAPYDVAAGAGFLVGSFFRVAKSAALAGQPIEGMDEGVFDLAKAAGQAWVQGGKLYWDNVAKNVTTTAAGNTLIGGGAQAQAAGDLVGRVYLTGQLS